MGAATTLPQTLDSSARRIKINGVVTDAVDVFFKGDAGAHPKIAPKLLENVPCDDLPQVLEGLVPYLSRR